MMKNLPQLNDRKGPSLSAIASLATLAISLWLEVDLYIALFRAVLVYLGFSLLLLAYRTLLGRFLSMSKEREEREFLERMMKEAEQEAKAQEKRKSVETNPRKPTVTA
ncbi:MAG: hypothetical protein ABH878_00445 [bacterium]